MYHAGRSLLLVSVITGNDLLSKITHFEYYTTVRQSIPLGGSWEACNIGLSPAPDAQLAAIGGSGGGRLLGVRCSQPLCTWAVRCRCRLLLLRGEPAASLTTRGTRLAALVHHARPCPSLGVALHPVLAAQSAQGEGR